MAVTPRHELLTMDSTTGDPTGTFSESMRRLDARVGTSVEAVLSTPPGSPVEGQMWLLGTTPTGAWAGHGNEIAYRTSTGWYYIEPFEGWTLYNKTTNSLQTYDGAFWTDVTGTDSSSNEGLESIELASTVADGNVTLDETTTTFQGVTLTDGMIFLPTAQTDATQNRPYVVSTTTDWAPYTGFEDTDAVTAGAAFVISNGDNVGKIFRLETTGVAGTDDLVWNTEAYTYVSRLVPISKNNASLSLTKTYDDKHIFATGSSAKTWTIPLNSTSNRSAGAGFRVQKFGTGNVTISGVSGVEINGVDAGSVSITEQYDTVEFIKKGANTWVAVWMLDPSSFVGGGGDVVGPASATDNAIALFDGTTGELLQDSAVVISTDGTLASDSDGKVPTEQAVKTYVDATVGGGGHNPQGVHTIFVPAVAMVSRTTNGAPAGTIETSTNKVMIKTLDFDASTQEFAQFSIRMPKSWNEGTVTAAFTWSHPSTTTNFGVVWAIQGLARSDDDALDTAFGTEQTIADTGGTTNDIYITSATSAITIAGTPASEDLVIFQVKRVPSDGSDTMAVDARLHGVTIYYTTNADNDT
jgi:hypothetical protein